MQIKRLISNTLAKFRAGSARGGLTAVEDIRAFKESAWQSKRMASYYRENVEERFFAGVTARLFLENIPAGAKVLDVGAGTGRLSRALAANDCKVVACDISKEMLSHIASHRGGAQIETLECNARTIPLPNDQFDAVVSMDLMVHFPDWEELLREQARLCKPGGVILFNFLSRENIASLKGDSSGTTKDFYYVYDYAPVATEAEIGTVARALGLSVESILPYNFFSENALFCRNLSKARVDDFVREFNESIKDEKVMRFVARFEEQIVRSLPTAMCSTMLVKLRKTI